MKKIIFLITIFLSSLFASENATKDDIKMLIELIKSNQEATNKQFEQMQNGMDKRFEQMQNGMDKRFEQMQNSMDKRFEQMQNSMDKRFEQVDKRFEDMNSTLRLMMIVFGSLFGLMFIYLIKDRYTIKKDVRVELAEEFEYELKQKADKQLLDRVVAIIEEMAKKDSFVKEILNKHNLILKT